MEERQDLYEITLILKEGSDISVVEKIVAEHGEVKKTTDLQVKQFVYPIGKLTAGHYVAFEFVANTDKIKELETAVKGEKSVIRHLITKALRKNPEPIRTGEYAKKPEQEAQTEEIVAEKIAEQPVAEAIEEPTEEVAPEAEIIEEVPESVVEAIAKPEAEEAEEVKPEEVEIVEEPKLEEPKEEEKKEDKLIAKKPRAKAEKVSAEELDKKLEELVKE